MRAEMLGVRMDLEFELGVGGFDDALGQVRRFERTRVYVAIGAIAVVGLAGLWLGTVVPAVIAALAIVVLGVLGLRWSRVVRVAARSGAGLRGSSRVSLAPGGITQRTAAHA